MTSRFSYEGKRVLVVGAATGMGAGTVELLGELGAEVIAMDVADVSSPVDQFVKVDLRDRATVDAALSEVEGVIDGLFSIAGVPDGVPGIELINIIAHRHIIETLVARKKISPGSGIALVSSTAGIGWRKNVETLREFLATPDWEAAKAWIDAHDGTTTYIFTKQAMNVFVTDNAHRLLQNGIRINAIQPGPTDSPFGLSNPELFLGTGKPYRDSMGKECMHPGQMADVLVFLNSDLASGINGELIIVDYGQVVSATAGTFPDPIVDYLYGA